MTEAPATNERVGTSGHAEADVRALARMQEVEPVWTGVRPAGDVLPFPDRTILHAGPPIVPGEAARPILNSAIMAVLFEGWAPDASTAEAMLQNGTIRLAPAQDHGAMVPLAAVLSPGMAAQVIVDKRNPANQVVSSINGGMVHAQRLGLAGSAVLAHLRWINGNLAATLSIIADRDIALIPIADAALGLGDDCHGRTVQGSRLVVEALASRLGSDTPERRFLDKSPGFFLNLWMAAALCIARAGEGPGSSIVTAIGGNGRTCGIKLGHAPDRWFTALATPPIGPLLDGFSEADRLGAIGDSALVDVLGFGAMLERSADYECGLAPHAGFATRALHLGLPARRIAASGGVPSIALGILDRAGRAGRIGGGIYHPPAELFAQTCQSIQ
jgi:hypothetical protein